MPSDPQPATLSPVAPAPSARIPEALARRVIIEHVRPAVDGGRFPVKRTPGESVAVTADVFGDGHDLLAIYLRYRSPQSRSALSAASAVSSWRELPMTLVAPGSDEYAASFTVETPGWYEYAVTAWVDRFETWRHDLTIKAAAGQDLSTPFLEGAALLRDAAARAGGTHGADAALLRARADALEAPTADEDRLSMALDDALDAAMTRHADRRGATTSAVYRVWVDRERARFGAWYEMFPRSFTPDPRRSATFGEAAGHLSYIAALGFDIVYLPPIHPIGVSFRKGANNTLVASPGDPGSPWAIGSRDGGHTAIEPGLGTLDDFAAFRAEAARLGLEVALDLAWQASPDHPWVREHPEWFRRAPDGTIKYAENPPKKYQDIYPFDFECADWRALWTALLEVTLFWVEQGVRVFRVDNPHTKNFGFWEWMIREVQARDPGVVFLSEAFTRPKPMRYLAKAGFTQSYTYFTWRNTKEELEAYFTELTGADVREYLRPNLFANTPDILHAYLQHGGRPAFEARLLLAATLGASYGIYSGFELCEQRAAAPGSEEYADSEKYQVRPRDWSRPGIGELIARVNQIRRAEPALQYDHTLRFHRTDNPEIIAYSKRAPSGDALLLMIVNLDPHRMQHGWVQVPEEARPADEGYAAHDLLDDVQYVWRGEWNYVRFDPGVRQGHIMKLVGLRAEG